MTEEEHHCEKCESYNKSAIDHGKSLRPTYYFGSRCPTCHPKDDTPHNLDALIKKLKRSVD